MKTDSYRTSCGAPIIPGEGPYSTPEGLFCLSCGVRLPIPPGVRVTVTITDRVAAATRDKA